MTDLRVYRLADAPRAARWAVTFFLATIGVAYAFGFLMVTLWVGLTPRELAEAYREPRPGVAGEHARVTERPINLEEALAEAEDHRIDTKLLIQDTHVHIPVYALIAFSLSLVALGLRWRPGFDVVVVLALFGGPILDFAGMWLTKFVAAGFAYLTLAGGWLMAASYLGVGLTAVWQIWLEKPGTRSARRKHELGE
jgi:hypothetical protein